MPRRKKLPDIPEIPNLSGLGRNGKDPHDWLVQKSNPLKSLSETDLSLVHFKILDAYLSRIDSHKPDERYVQFKKGELEQLLGVTRMHRDELDKRLDGLFRAVTIRDERKPKSFVKIGLFAKAECEQDDDGLWQVRLACTAEAMEYIFNIENLGYLRYRLRNVINLTSRYSYVMFIYLEARKNSNLRNKWEVSLSELKSLLNCTAERYNEFKHFNAEILKKCCTEINEKTDIKYSYKPLKKSGRKVSAIEFSIDKFSELTEISEPEIKEPVQLKFDEEGMDSETQNLLLLSSACDDEFNINEMKVIFAIISTIDLPEHESGIQIARFHYLRERYTMFQIEAGKKDIKNHFLYFKKMIENDKKKSSKGN